MSYLSQETVYGTRIVNTLHAGEMSVVCVTNINLATAPPAHGHTRVAFFNFHIYLSVFWSDLLSKPSLLQEIFLYVLPTSIFHMGLLPIYPNLPIFLSNFNGVVFIITLFSCRFTKKPQTKYQIHYQIGQIQKQKSMVWKGSLPRM